MVQPVVKPVVKPVVEHVAEPVVERVEPVAEPELSKPIEPRRSKRVRKPMQLEIEQPATQPKTRKTKKPRKQRAVIQEQPTEPTTESEQIPKERELLKRNYVRSAPAPSSETLQLLQNLYYKEMLIFGRDKLFKYIQENHADIKVSRRQINDWLKLQEINQINTGHKTSKDIKATVVKKTHKQIAMDLVDMSKHEMRGYK